MSYTFETSKPCPLCHRGVDAVRLRGEDHLRVSCHLRRASDGFCDGSFTIIPRPERRP